MKGQKKFSRQYEWQQRQRKKGLCVICGGKVATKNHCKKHAAAENKRGKVNYRKKIGLPENAVLKRGRPSK